jgi:hypothetical protein
MSATALSVTATGVVSSALLGSVFIILCCGAAQIMWIFCVEAKTKKERGMPYSKGFLKIYRIYDIHRQRWPLSMLELERDLWEFGPHTAPLVIDTASPAKPSNHEGSKNQLSQQSSTDTMLSEK